VSGIRDLHNFIGGERVSARSGAWLDDVGPATNTLIARIPRSNADDVADAVAAANTAFRGEWSDWSRLQRADLLEAIADEIARRAPEIAEAESLDTGKPITLASTVDIPRSESNFRFFAGAVRHDETASHHMQGALNYTLRQPLGVAGLITPWNLPLYLLSWKVAPALAMGNTVVAKPSELTPYTATLLAEVFETVGAPKGIFNLVHGLGAEAGQAIVEHPDVPLVSFTGGTATGKRVAATAAPMFKKLSLELGGKNPTLVFADADLDEAVPGAARAGFLNQGQVCLCGSRILVEASIAEAFTERLVEHVQGMRIGAPNDPEVRLGAVISQDHRAKVESYIALAKEEGGTILTGDARPNLPAPYDQGAFMKPTVIGGLPITARCATEEIFGPVVTVHAFGDEAEAIAMANGVRYGLAASVWTRDLKRAHRVSAALESGMVWVNTWLLRDLRVPFGGMKDSGVGREGGKHSLEFFSEARNICIKL
jgi:aminomuconate-semialdehyde/2-hydroxymuconate-6-semialdehyde dehydrogenase